MDEQAKKTALRMVPYGLYAVGVRASEVTDPREHLRAFIGSWVSQCSFKPPLVMMGVKRGTRGHEFITESGVFVLNAFGTGQRDLAKPLLGDPEVTDTTIGGHPYRTGKTGAPILADLPAYVECKVVAIHDHDGDHDIVVGEVVDAGIAGGEMVALTSAETGWTYAG